MKRIVFQFASLLLFVAIAVTQFRCAEDDARGNDTSENTAKKDSSAIENESAEPNKDEEKIPVEVSTLESGEISSYILLSSNLETEKMADVFTRVQGIVKGILVEEGNYIQKGAVMAKLEAEEYELATQKAKVNYLQEKNAFERSKEMYERKLLSSEEFEQAKFRAEAAKIDYEQAKLDLDYTNIKAPISGVVGERLVRIGDRIQQSDKLFSVVNTNEIIAIVHVPEKEIGKIVKGQRAFVTSDNLGEEQFAGRVKRVSPVVDPESGTFKVTIGIRNIHHKLRPGMFVNVHIVTDTHKKAVLVPKTAIVYENEQMYVFAARDSIAEKIELTPGFENYHYVESLERLSSGDRVIVVGQAGLKDKANIRIVSQD